MTLPRWPHQELAFQRSKALPALTHIYGLCDPDTGHLRYVGKTVGSIEARLRGHLNPSNWKNKSHRAYWLRALVKRGKIPESFLIETVPHDIDWKEAEKFWISYFRSLGCHLVNTGPGGEGLVSANKTSFRKGQAAWNKGLKYSEETRKKISDIQKGKPKGKWTLAQRLAHSERMKLIHNFEPARIALKIKGRIRSKEAIAKQREKMLALAAKGWSPRPKGSTPWNKGKKGVQKMPKWTVERRAKQKATCLAKKAPSNV